MSLGWFATGGGGGGGAPALELHFLRGKAHAHWQAGNGQARLEQDWRALGLRVRRELVPPLRRPDPSQPSALSRAEESREAPVAYASLDGRSFRNPTVAAVLYCVNRWVGASRRPARRRLPHRRVVVVVRVATWASRIQLDGLSALVLDTSRALGARKISTDRLPIAVARVRRRYAASEPGGSARPCSAPPSPSHLPKRKVRSTRDDGSERIACRRIFLRGARVIRRPMRRCIPALLVMRQRVTR